jgi:hypothetical protein
MRHPFGASTLFISVKTIVAEPLTVHGHPRASPLNYCPHHPSTESLQNPVCPYNVLVLVKEGRLEDLAFAPNDWVDGVWHDVTPIPYTLGA